MAGDRIIGGFDIDTYTSAPLRVCRAAYLDVPPKWVFTVISDHANADLWLPFITQVHVNRGHADVRDGMGTIRYLHTDFIYAVRQYVIAFHPPRLIAYSIEQNAIISDHVGVMYLETDRYGGTNFMWQHYFRNAVLPFITEPLWSAAFDLGCRLALRNLIAHFGGEMR